MIGLRMSAMVWGEIVQSKYYFSIRKVLGIVGFILGERCSEEGVLVVCDPCARY